MPLLNRLPASPAAGLVHVVVESPRGATSKIKCDEKLAAFTLSRPLPLGLSYPHDWGFVSGTVASDGDPLDALLLSEGSTFPGMVIRARPIGGSSPCSSSRDRRSCARAPAPLAAGSSPRSAALSLRLHRY
jgi:inorganic pyrophosphatase